jgi:hypothetical protein
MNWVKDVLLWVAGSAVALLAVVRGLFMRRLRLTNRQSAALFDLIRKRAWSFVLVNEEAGEKPPTVYMAVCVVDGVLCYVNAAERMLQAGWQGTDTVVDVLLFRWQCRRLLRVLCEAQKGLEEEVPVYLLASWDASRIGTLSLAQEIPRPYMEADRFADVEAAVQQVIDGQRQKMGVLLHGAPGNGKSFFVRYLAMRYRLPIYIVLFEAKTTNQEIVRMFAQIKGPCMVLFEDFDNCFHGRTCCLPEAQCTLDPLLNVLDGLYSTPRQVVFVMTANHLEHIDEALQRRPSRFQFVREVGAPTEAMRRQIFGDLPGAEAAVVRTAGWSLDFLLRERERMLTKEEKQ